MFTYDQLLTKLKKELQTLSLSGDPKGLYEPINYELSLGGKRLRPVLCLMAYNLYSEEITTAMSAALGIEVFHNFTLLHDDIMDKADMRRGKPTVHNIWNNNTAILSGDAMQILAYQLICKSPVQYLKPLIDIFSKTAMEVCEGQQFDMDYETRDKVTAEEYLDMIRLKTAVLIAASLKIGAILGGASEEDADKLYSFGQNIGLAFQLKDDLLDVYGNPAVFGKNIGGDITSNKKTYLMISALERANGSQLTQLERWIAKEEPARASEKIAAVTEIYNQIGVKELCEEKMKEYYRNALSDLEKVSIEQSRKEQLREVAASLMDRDV